MQKLIVFNSISLDGFFTDANGDMRWAHNPRKDDEWDAFVAGNAAGGGTLLFGRVTYDLMAGYWPTPMAKQSSPEVAEGMNRMKKVVFSRTMTESPWNNTTIFKGDIAQKVRAMKGEPGNGITILGSGSIVSQLTREWLIDEYQLVVTPVILGKGRTLFDGLQDKMDLKLLSSRQFANGNVVLKYQGEK